MEALTSVWLEDAMADWTGRWRRSGGQDRLGGAVSRSDDGSGSWSLDLELGREGADGRNCNGHLAQSVGSARAQWSADFSVLMMSRLTEALMPIEMVVESRVPDVLEDILSPNWKGNNGMSG